MKLKNFLKALIPSVAAAAMLPCSAMTAFAADEAAADGAAAQQASMLPSLIFLIVIFVVMYFIMIRPQKKKEKETKAMQENIQIGDEIVTIGGIVGIVVRKGDDNVVIETGGERNKMRIKLWAISENTSAQERAKEAQAASKKQAQQETGVALSKVKDDEKPTKKKKKKSE